jgi:hypothetical protein
MELDELKSIWKKSTTATSDSSRENAPEVSRILETSRKGIGKVFAVEIVVAIVLYVGFVLMVVLSGLAIQSFIYKLIIITALFALPIYYRLYRSIRFLSDMDFSADLKSNLVQFLVHYKTSLRFYKWATYLMVIVILIFFFTDDSFIALSTSLKIGTMLYMAFVSVIVGPLVNRVYGKRIHAIEGLLAD